MKSTTPPRMFINHQGNTLQAYTSLGCNAQARVHFKEFTTSKCLTKSLTGKRNSFLRIHNITFGLNSLDINHR